MPGFEGKVEVGVLCEFKRPAWRERGGGVSGRGSGPMAVLVSLAVAQKAGTKMACPGKWKHGPTSA